MTTSDICANPYKKDFPLLAQNPEISFLDSAATAQRPQAVIDAQATFYQTMNANPLRGLYAWSIEATDAIDTARKHIAHFIGASDSDEIIFTRNASESLNLLARSLGSYTLGEGDEVVISILEHHSNLIPWQQICKETGAKLLYLYPDKEGFFSDAEIEEKITDACKIVSITGVSNVLGVQTPLKKIIARAHEKGAYTLIDAAQMVPHMPVDVIDLDCDALVFSGHKLMSPMGVGVLWAKRKLLESIPPFLTGGEMIDDVQEQSAIWAPIPAKFEAGTQDAAGIYALDAALRYIETIGFDAIQKREEALTNYCVEQLENLDFIEIYGPKDPQKHIGVCAFNVNGIHPHDVASLLDSKKVCIRAGHHCAQPLMTWLDIQSCCRASCAFYNDKEDIDRFIDALNFVWGIFHG